MVFACYVKPGSASAEMRKAIPDPRWLAECRVDPVNVVGGRFPYLADGTHFYLELFPRTDSKDEYWRIDFTLSSGKRNECLSSDDAIRFLNGTLIRKDVRIEEFILMYPFPQRRSLSQVEEMHNRRGVGLRVQAEGWYDLERAGSSP